MKQAAAATTGDLDSSDTFTAQNAAAYASPAALNGYSKHTGLWEVEARLIGTHFRPKTVTYVAGARVGDMFRVPTLAHDPTFPGRYSVGKVLNLHAIEHCIAEDCREYDLTRGDEDYKVWLAGILRPNVNVRLYHSRLARRAASATGWVISKLRNQN